MPPPGVLRYDEDDPYLVVAADKGTAHLSDTANAISQRYKFWLDDAFASGGCAGYDHKVDGHHVARRLDERRAPLPRDGHRHPQDVDPRRRRRRHERRRVRQRHAAERPDQARRRVQPQARVHRSGAGSGEVVRRAQAAVQHARHAVERLQRASADQQGRRRLRARGEGDHAVARGAEAARPDGEDGHRPRHRARDPRARGRPDVVRRHRHVRQGLDRDRTARSATRSTTTSASTRPSCARR